MVRIPYRSGVRDIGHDQTTPDYKRDMVDNILPVGWMPVGVWLGVDLRWWWVAIVSGIIWFYYAKKLAFCFLALHRQQQVDNVLGRE